MIAKKKNQDDSASDRVDSIETSINNLEQKFESIENGYSTVLNVTKSLTDKIGALKDVLAGKLRTEETQPAETVLSTKEIIREPDVALVAKSEAETAVTTESYEPKIVGFLCNWCSYAGADKAGSAQNPYPTNVRIVKVMCSGRVDPEFILKAFKEGADGVMILACHPGDCHYKEGNYRAAQRYQMLKKLLDQYGIEEDRCYFDYVSAGDGEKFVKVITETVAKVKALGPLKLLA